MKRRGFIRTIAAAPAGSLLWAQHQPGPAGRQNEAQNLPIPETAVSDVVASTVPRFLTADQLATLRKLAEMFFPPINGYPGAIDAGAPEFLDYYTGASAAYRQQFYRLGLDDLNQQSKTNFKKPFAELNAAQFDALVQPMFKPIPENRSSIDLGPFINRVHQDLRTATMNSREWAQAAEKAGGRVAAGQYWNKVDPTILLK